MVTALAERLVRELALGGRINLESVYLKGEERGIKRSMLSEALGRLASEGVIKVKKGVIEVVE